MFRYLKIFSSSGNFTGPYCALVESDDMNTAMNGGYSINYLMLPCA